jgi:S1-C subfamily serine protease
MKDKKLVVGLVVAALAVGVGIGAVSNAPAAHADLITDFLHSLIAPFTASTTKVATGTASQVIAPANVPLYQPVVDYENAVVSAVKKASPAVVSITISEDVPVVEQCPTNPFQNLPPDFQQYFGNDFPDLSQPCTNSGQTQLQAVGGGSGFIISPDGLILTNKHVVSDTGAQYSVLTNDGKTYAAKVLARDPVQDLAVLKIDATGLPTVSLGDSDSLQLGQSAIAIGNALGQFSNSVSVGVISGLSRTVTATGGLSGDNVETIHGVIQTDAAINPGNSGGPLLDLQGNVIAINTAIASGAENIGFAIPINQAKRDISQVQSTGNIQTPYLGVRYLPIDLTVAQQQNLSTNQGALIQGATSSPAIMPNSPADKAGIQSGDIITAINGQAIDANHDLATLISQHNVGDTITLTIIRDGKTMTIQVKLAARPSGS